MTYPYRAQSEGYTIHVTKRSIVYTLYGYHVVLWYDLYPVRRRPGIRCRVSYEQD